MLVTLEFDADLVVVDPQVSFAVTNHRLRHHLLHLLCDDADIGTIIAVITEAIIAKAVGKMAKQDDVVLDRDVGSAPAAATTATATAEATATTTSETTAPTTTEAASATAAEAMATAAAEAATTTDRGPVDVRVTTAGPRVSYPSVRRSLRCLVPSARRPLSRDGPATAWPLSHTGSATAWPLSCTTGSATGGKLPRARPPAAGPQTSSGSATSRKLPYARSLPCTGP